MYYNKSLISSAFILDIPEYWDEFIEFAPKVTEYTGPGEIVVSATAMGSYDNISNAKAIISALLLQNGNALVGADEFSGERFGTLSSEEGIDQSMQAIDFYTSFAQFGSSTYSWNEALGDSQNKFIAGEVATYFGRASEVEDISRKNPNLDFGVSLLPQLRSTNNRITQGSMLGVAISKQTKNVMGAFSTASNITAEGFSGGLAAALLVAPANKALLGNTPDDAFLTLVYNSAIISAGWVDPAPSRTSDLFRNIIRNVNSSALSTEEALQRANRDLDTILDQTINRFNATN
jgi:ABC-type glycerol-3-phosphate transport system substrate-binding protein